MSTAKVQAFFDVNTFTVTYVVSDPNTRDSIVIDPVLDYDALSSQTSTESVSKVVSYIESEGLRLRAVLETHAHADHISASQYLKQLYSVPVGIGRDIDQVQRVFAKVFNFSASVPVDGTQFDLLIDPAEEYDFGSLHMKPLATPGHTPACMSYLICDAVFVGDAVFMEDYGTGRADFPGGSAVDLYRSVSKILFSLPDETRVFVGHDYQPGGRELRFESTVARQRSSNVQLDGSTSRDEFVNRRNKRDETLRPPRLIYQSVQINVFGGTLPEADENGIRYLKTPLNMRKPTDENGRLVEEEVEAAQ